MPFHTHRSFFEFWVIAAIVLLSGIYLWRHPEPDLDSPDIYIAVPIVDGVTPKCPDGYEDPEVITPDTFRCTIILK